MTVYVDDMLMEARPFGYRGRYPAKWSHLFADTPKELETFAVEVLGLQPGWVQRPGTHREHFDVIAHVRLEAIKAGAVKISYPYDVGTLLRARHVVCNCADLTQCNWGELVTSTCADDNDDSDNLYLTTAHRTPPKSRKAPCDYE